MSPRLVDVSEFCGYGTSQTIIKEKEKMCNKRKKILQN